MTDLLCRVQVASIQTLQQRAIPAVDLVVIDEAHRWFKLLGTWMAAPSWASVPFIGLSATPWTKGLGKHYSDLVQVITTADLIAAGHLSPFRVYAPSHPDLSKVRTVAGDFHEGDLGEAMNKPHLVADVVQTWRRQAENRPTFVFAVDRAHAKHLQREFTGAGIAAGYIDAYTKPLDREALFRQFTAAEVRVIVSVGCLAHRRGHKEGWAAHKFREMTGVWPDRYHDAPLIEPTPLVLSWIKSRQIAWVKRPRGRYAPSA